MKRYRIQIEIIECKFEVQNKNYRKQVKKTGKKITNGKKSNIATLDMPFKMKCYRQKTTHNPVKTTHYLPRKTFNLVKKTY